LRLREYGNGTHALRCALLLLPVLPLAGCSAWKAIPGQKRFAPLDELARSDSAVVRLYCAPVPSVEWLAVHVWFVVKPAGSHAFERWELWQDDSVTPRVANGTHYGHVYRNLQGPAGHVGAGGTRLLAEQVGPEAESVIRFIQSQSPCYPWRSEYATFPGPNSNTYIQWALDNSGWHVRLPRAAIGKDWHTGETPVPQEPPRPTESQPCR
jgi:hypothetical protein